MIKLKRCKWIFIVWHKMIVLYLFPFLSWNQCIHAYTTVLTESYPFENYTVYNNNYNASDFSSIIYETLVDVNSSKIVYNDDELFVQETTTRETTITTQTSHLDVYLNDDPSIGVTTKEFLKKVINGSTSAIIDSTLIPKNLTTWPTKHVANVEGDIILGGLMMVHEREDTIICGPIMAQGGIQALETMLFTLDYINGVGLLPNISIGAHILDDCDKGKCFCRFLYNKTFHKKKYLLYIEKHKENCKLIFKPFFLFIFSNRKQIYRHTWPGNGGRLYQR